MQMPKMLGTANTFKQVSIIGGGLMGSGIAQVVAQKGQMVNLVEVNDSILKISRAKIEQDIEKLSKKLYKDSKESSSYFDQVLGRINYFADIPKAVESSNIVVEAVVENFDIKKNIFLSVEEAAPEEAILCTNTSSLSISRIGSVLKKQDRFGGVHFFNPVPLMNLVEVIRSDKTSDKTYEMLFAWTKSIGRVPVACKDVPGFIVNKLLAVFIAEAIKMYEKGDASKEAIDTAIKLGANHPMGPIELSDLIGHDTVAMIFKNLREGEPENKMFEPLKSQIRLLEEGKLGVKSGEGYYKYPRKSTTSLS
ncbi:hydroxyacyl-coenzyme A dehydrogenase, mitochondrial-like isoform X1 [Cimex lectularius]|uniref:3-hydroxyacyl-CoA dehydrogenase n=1 Tax=Cimex lectularius TaxID=79782 RepID=A0A8I6TJ68_CIMLE|nr:hydroxyacyl-coenzyme A dehydrogenase, mitochondrial-like isoform X1 [Cimex lectularius]